MTASNQISTITQKGQTTIPANIRQALNLHPGDKIRFEIIKNQVIIKKLQPFEVEYYKALTSTLSEWSSKEDEEDYGNL